MLQHIPALMSKGSPVAVKFTEEKGVQSPFLYCELIQKARYGESFLIKSQGCIVGGYVLGESEENPVEYYYKKNRYKDREAATRAVSNLKRLKKTGSIRIAPYSGQDFDILILFLKPERVMRIVQSYSYQHGNPIELITGGIASICSDITAYPMQGKIGISPGCKGSRKHSGYAEDELIAGIPFQISFEIEEALSKIPRIFD
jgi:uncharacterized protein (DUF169 family)